MKFRKFVLEDEDAKSSVEKSDAVICELECDTCDFETTTEEFVEGDICPDCNEGVLVKEECSDDLDDDGDCD